MEPYLAEIRLFAGNFAPRGWALCQGQILPINSNQSLYSLLGTTYGGDGRTSFALPDFRGRVPVSAGQGAGLSNWSAGQKAGEEQNFITVNEMPAHTHQITVAAKIKCIPGIGHHPLPADSVIAESKQEPGDTMYTDAANHNVDMAGGGTISGLTLANTGGGQGVNNVAPVQGLNYIICLQGLFPSRN